MSVDKQFKFRKQLSPYLNSMSQMACFVENYHQFDLWVESELKVDRLMAQARRELNKSEFDLLQAWVEKERCHSWNIA